MRIGPASVLAGIAGIWIGPRLAPALDHISLIKASPKEACNPVVLCDCSQLGHIVWGLFASLCLCFLLLVRQCRRHRPLTNGVSFAPVRRKGLEGRAVSAANLL